MSASLDIIDADTLACRLTLLELDDNDLWQSWTLLMQELDLDVDVLDLDLDDLDLCDLEQSRALLMQQGLLFISGPLGATTIRRMAMNGRDSNKGSHLYI